VIGSKFYDSIAYGYLFQIKDSAISSLIVAIAYSVDL